MTKKNQKSTARASGTWTEVKAAWKKTRKFLDSDGVLPWIVNLLIAFVIIKFVVYPVLGFIFGTGLPIVAVVSSSMDHDAIDGNICGVRVSDYSGSFDEYWSTCGSWYEARGITKEQFREFSFKNGFAKGDIMIVLGDSRSEVKQGDILIFSARQNYPIIHRVMNITGAKGERVFETKGDHNSDQIKEYVMLDGSGIAHAPAQGSVRLVDETQIAESQVVGKAVLKIPWLGWIKIWFTDLIMWIASIF